MVHRFPRYEKLLGLYPKAYRDKYARPMTQTLADMLGDQTNTRGKILVWLRVSLDLPVSIMNQNSLALGGNDMRETPNYIRRNGIIASALLVPFVLAILAGSLDHQLHNSWLWRTPALVVWVALLPALAFLLAVSSYILYAASSSLRQNWMSRLFDIKHTWPVVLTGLVGLGIIGLVLFHDSAHCVADNPYKEAHNFNQTLQCTKRGFLGG